MHLLRIESRSIDGTAEAVDLGQSPADIVALSFTDTDLAVLAAAWEAGQGTLPSLRLASLASLRHPYSVDLYADKVLSKARFVLVRLLGGMDYWRYGVDELANLARSSGFHLAIVPGDHRIDERLDEASTLPPEALRRIGSYFAAGGVENIARLPALRRRLFFPATRGAGPRAGSVVRVLRAGDASAPRPARHSALIVFYRAAMLAADTAPVTALAHALSSRGFRVAAVYVTSLKDETAATPLRAHLAAHRPDVILNLTAFSARLDAGGSVLDTADAPVFQLALSGGSHPQWAASQRGLGPADLAMNVVLPEFDGRIIGGAISFKAETQRNAMLEFTRLVHQPEPYGIAYAADLAMGWADLARTPRAGAAPRLHPVRLSRQGRPHRLRRRPRHPRQRHRHRRPAGAGGIRGRTARTMNRVGSGSVGDLSRHGGEGPPSTPSLSRRRDVTLRPVHDVADYERSVHLPAAFVAQSARRMATRRDDPAVRDGMFHFRIVRAGNLLIAVQPDRGSPASRKTEYHDAALPPRHGYVAFYLWLRHGRAGPRHHPLRHARHAGMAARQGHRAVGRLRPARRPRAGAADLSVHRQQPRRSRAGEAAHRRRHHRPPDARR